MHRTQLLLEKWQYGALKTLAQNKGESISHVLRDLLTRVLPKMPARRLSQIHRIGKDRKMNARDHDAILYGNKSST